MLNFIVYYFIGLSDSQKNEFSLTQEAQVPETQKTPDQEIQVPTM